MKPLKLISTLLVSTILMSGCAVSTDSTVIGAPAPITGKTESTNKSDKHLPSSIAVLPFSNRTESEFAYTVVRKTLVNHFSTKNYRMLNWRDVDARLKLAGLDSAAKVNAKSPAEIRQILGVDGLIYGDITHYDKKFAGIYSQIAVGVELNFINAQDENIWKVKDVKRSHAGGVSASPVGLIMNALVAANHLRGDINLYRAADDLGRALAKDMPEPAAVSQRKKPVITNVVHSGVGQYLKYGDTLEIGIEGTPGLIAVAAIDGIGTVDLKEQEPGQYVGKIALNKNQNATNVAVVGRLQDDFGQISSWVSTYGLLNVDNKAPGLVKDPSVESRNDSVKITWVKPEDQDIASYTISYANSETGDPLASFKSPNSEFTIEELTNFQTIYISVSAIDKAGNQGTGTTLPATPAPDTRYGQANELTSVIPTTITGVNRLTLAGGPYHLNAASKIATDGVLFIAPGVEITVAPAGKLSVLGELYSFGTKKQPIIVQGAKGQMFPEFLILQSNQTIDLNGLAIDNAGIPIQINAGSPRINDCNLTNNNFNGMTIGGSARPVISNCNISDAQASGVLISGQAQPEFKNNTFSNNQPFQIQNGSNYELDVKGNTFTPAASPMTILGPAVY